MSTTDHGQELKALLLDAATKPQRVADLLDGLPHDDRVAAVRSLGSRHLHRMWDLVDGFGELTLDFYVPAGTAALTPVRHYGKNSLPAFTIFEKRFYRLSDTELRLRRAPPVVRVHHRKRRGHLHPRGVLTPWVTTRLARRRR